MVRSLSPIPQFNALSTPAHFKNRQRGARVPDLTLISVINLNAHFRLQASPPLPKTANGKFRVECVSREKKPSAFAKTTQPACRKISGATATQEEGRKSRAAPDRSVWQSRWERRGI